VSCVTATYAVDETPPSGHPLRPGAAPRAIRAALLPEDQPKFDVAYSEALAEARASQDLTELFTVLEEWRRIAVIQSDPARFHQAARRVAGLLTGQSVPDDEPLAVTRAKAGM